MTEGAIVAIVVSLIAAVAGIVTAIIQTRSVKKQQNEIHHEVKNNGGSSMKDAVDRIEKMVIAQSGDIRETNAMLNGVAALVAQNSTNIEHLRDHETEFDKRMIALEADKGGRRKED